MRVSPYPWQQTAALDRSTTAGAPYTTLVKIERSPPRKTISAVEKPIMIHSGVMEAFSAVRFCTESEEDMQQGCGADSNR